MIQIRHQQYSKLNEYFLVYKIQEKQDVIKYMLNNNFNEVLDISLKFPKNDHYFLLDESYFHFFRFDIFLEKEDEVNLQELNEIVKNKKDGIKVETRNSELLNSYIDSIYVDWEKKQFVMWEKWSIFFRLYMVYIDKICLNRFNSFYWDILNNKYINIVPQSFNTILFLRDKLEKENFLLMYVNENNCKIIKVRQWFFESIDMLNFGIWSLKEMYKDNWIINYRYKTYEEIENNLLAKGLVTDTLKFYCELLIKRIFEKNLIWTDLILISSITKNTHFMEIFNQQYSKINNNYIVPFHYSNSLNTYSKEREPEDMDALILINRDKQINKLLNN